MARILSLISLVLMSFVFISIVLINIGGVARSDSYISYELAKNTQFDLLHWRLVPTQYSSTTSSTSAASYNFGTSVFLNRICPITTYRSTGNLVASRSQCRNGGINRVVSFANIYSSLTSFSAPGVRPYSTFDTINFNPAFAFFLLSAMAAVVLLFTSLGGVFRSSRTLKMFNIVVSAMQTLFIIIAASVITGQMVHLRNQLNDRRISTFRIDNVGLGSVAFGLIWSSVFASILTLGAWVLALSKDEKKVVHEEKRMSYDTQAS